MPPQKRDEEGKLLVELAASWGRGVIHVFDQGFSSAFWLGVLLAYNLRFVLRWRKDSQLLDAEAQPKPDLEDRAGQTWLVATHGVGCAAGELRGGDGARAPGRSS